MTTNSIDISSKGARRPSRLTLDAVLDIAGASKLHAKLKKSASKGVDINLNAAGVETIDTTALQLILAFVRLVRKSGHNVNWQSPSLALVKTAGLTGLEQELGLVQASA